MRGSRGFVRRVDQYQVVIDPTRDAIEVRRPLPTGPTPDDTVVSLYRFAAVHRLELFVGRDGSHRLILAIGSREGVDLGAEVTRAQGLDFGKSVARLLHVSLDIRDGDFLEAYFREQGPILSRIHDGKHLIEAELVDPIDPQDELSPWRSSRRKRERAASEASGGGRAGLGPDRDPWDGVGFDRIEPESCSVDDLLIEILADPSTYDDGPFALPRVRTAPEVEAVFPLPTPIDPPPMTAEAEALVRASHRPPRQPEFERSQRFAWLRAALRALTA